MVGWWQPETPVHALRAGATSVLSSVKVTSYVVPGRRTLLALASWDPGNVSVVLGIDWPTLQLNASAVHKLSAPYIHGVQPQREWALDEPIRVQPEQGWLIMVAPSQTDMVGQKQKTDDVRVSSRCPPLADTTVPPSAWLSSCRP